MAKWWRLFPFASCIDPFIPKKQTIVMTLNVARIDFPYLGLINNLIFITSKAAGWWRLLNRHSPICQYTIATDSGVTCNIILSCIYCDTNSNISNLLYTKHYSNTIPATCALLNRPLSVLCFAASITVVLHY